MSKSIVLSPRHGVNPSVEKCFICGTDVGVVLFGRIGYRDKEAPRSCCVTREPCAQCAEWMRMGVILISVRDGESGQNPYRTGNMCVVKEETLARLITPLEHAKKVLKQRVAFVEDSVWKALGLETREDVSCVEEN